MDFFLIRYLSRSYENIKKLAARIEEIYRTNDKFGRHSVCVFAIAVAVLNLVLTVAGNLITGQFSENRTSLAIYIVVNIIVIAVLVFDERKLKEYKAKKGMSDKEEAFLRAIAAEKGVNPITLKKIEKNENEAEKPEQPAIQKAAPVQQKAPQKKDTISDFLSADEIAEMELKQEREKKKE